ncbi:hypothetical protein PAXINDRAFT_18416 [Paxillus involutus ATCC 200175]|uniref:Uncharacterized protein n=1 Tax=Paxillus involutus ATCC 200175 TaxID=664439 RepID=A0A0C9TBK6_PAXIN|nr:hypothetical protein PAXINDRAFT_18416 [Paxillus involutus ATCC 200175]
MPAIGSGRVVNPIEYLCRAGKPVCDRNRRMLKAMVLKLLIPHNYVKRSVLWKRLCHKAENLHFTILNWPEEMPVPDTQFDFHKLDANEVLKLLANFLIDRLGPMYKPEGEDDGENSKGKGKGKGKAVKEPYVPQDGDDLAFMAWPRDVINIYRRASKILLTIGGLHGKKPLASIVDEHDKDVIDEERPGLACIEQIVSPLPHLTMMVAPLNGHAPLHITMCLTTLAPLIIIVRLRLRLVHLHLNADTPHVGLLTAWPLHPGRSGVASMTMLIATNSKK